MGKADEDAHDEWEGDEDPLESIAAGLGVVLMGVLAVVLLALNVEWWWIAFVIGGGLIPLFYGLADWYVDRERDVAAGEPDDAQDALEVLRSRYARGDLSESEFERRVERLVETETVEDARAVVERQAGRPAADEGDAERDLERERE